MPLSPNVDPQTFAGASVTHEGTAGALNDFLFESIDMSPFQWWSLSIIGSAHTGRLSWQCSMDNFASGDPVGMYAYQIGLPSAYYLNATDVGSQTQIFHGPKFANYFRVIMDEYTSGSVTALLALYSNSNYPGTINAIQTGRWAAGVAINSNLNGSKVFRLVSANTDNASVIKNSVGMVYGYDIYNKNAAERYVKLYNMSTTPAPATDNAHLVRTIGIPPHGSKVFHSTTGFQDFPNGIAMAAVTGIDDTDDTAVGAGDLAINIDYSPD